MQSRTTPLNTCGEITSVPVAAPANAANSILPEFVRLPRSRQRELFTGLSRSVLNSLILATKENGFKPPVRSVCLRKKGAVRGTRLIVLDSLRKHLYSTLATQEGA